MNAILDFNTDLSAFKKKTFDCSLGLTSDAGNCSSSNERIADLGKGEARENERREEKKRP